MSEERETLLGFGLDDEAWLARLRGYRARPLEVKLGPYELLSEIGRGGQGVVYKALQPGTERIIAIKRVTTGPAGSSAFRQRFEREVRTAAALNHPNIVTVFGCDTIDGQPILLMEYVEGVPLDRWSAVGPSHEATEARRHEGEGRGGEGETRSDEGTSTFSRDSTRSAYPSPTIRSQTRDGVREVLELFVKICDAVQHAHQRGVIHRDLKPSNVLVVDGTKGTGNREQGTETAEPKVLDFGLAKAINQPADEADAVAPGSGAPIPVGGSSRVTLTEAGQFLGTPAFAAPEQIRGEHDAVDVRTDVYAIGGMLHLTLTGRPMFERSRDLASLIEAVERRVPVPPSSVNPALDREIDAIVLTATAREMDRRYASVDALRADLQRYLDGRPVLACPQTRTYRFQKFVKGHRGAVGAAAAFVLLLAGAAISSTLLYLRSEGHRASAETALGAESDARARAEAQEKAAKLEVSKQESINAFLNQMLARADLIKEKGKQVTVREALDAAAAELASSEAKLDPEVEAALRMTIGHTYGSLGPGQECEPQYRAALELRRQVHGDIHASVLESAQALARTLRYQGRSDESEAMFEMVLQNRRALLGTNSPYVAQTLSSLGILRRTRGAYLESEAAYREALQVYRANFGDDVDAGLVLYNWAALYVAQGRHEEALALYREAKDILVRTTGEQSDDVAALHIQAAPTLYGLGHKEEARDWMEAGIDVFRALGLPEHPQVALGHTLQSSMAITEGDYRLAEELAREAVRMHRASVDFKPELLALALKALASALQAQGRLEEALAAACEGAELLDSTGLGRGLDAIAAELKVGELRLALGQFAEAEESLLRAAERAEVVLQGAPGPRAEFSWSKACQLLVQLYAAWDAAEPDRGYAQKADHWRANAEPPPASDLAYGESKASQY